MHWGHLGHFNVGSSHSTSEARRWHQGIVVGDVVRRLIARTIARLVSKKAESAIVLGQV